MEYSYHKWNSITNIHNVFIPLALRLLKGTSLLVTHVYTIDNAQEPHIPIHVEVGSVHVKQDTCFLTTTAMKVNTWVNIIFREFIHKCTAAYSIYT